VVLGSDAGPKKIETIKKNNIPTINEDGLFQLVRTLPAHGGSGKTGQLAAAKKETEERKVMEMATEMAAQAKAHKALAGSDVETQLWTEKYAPTNLKEVCGNKTLVEKLQRWLKAWYVHVEMLIQACKCQGKL
jgi:replication factor C subunit 1